MHRRERADQRVGRGYSTHRVVGEPCLDGLAERGGDEVVPDARVDLVADRSLDRQRAEQGRRDDVGEDGDVIVELAPGGVLAVAARELEEGLLGALAGRTLDEQPAGLAVAQRRCVRRDRPRREPEIEAEVGDQGLRHQRDQVAVARQPGRHAREGLGRDRGASGVVEPLEDEDREAGAGEVGRRDQAVVPAADDDHVIVLVLRSHRSNLGHVSVRCRVRLRQVARATVACARRWSVLVGGAETAREGWHVTRPWVMPVVGLLALAAFFGTFAVYGTPEGGHAIGIWPVALASAPLLVTRRPSTAVLLALVYVVALLTIWTGRPFDVSVGFAAAVTAETWVFWRIFTGGDPRPAHALHRRGARPVHRGRPRRRHGRRGSRGPDQRGHGLGLSGHPRPGVGCLGAGVAARGDAVLRTAARPWGHGPALGADRAVGADR